jgi:hydrogenase maturation factor
MNLIYGRIVEMFPEDGLLTGKIRVAGAIKRVSLDLLVEPRVGDRVLICDGVAISKVEAQTTTEINHVSGNSG